MKFRRFQSLEVAPLPGAGIAHGRRAADQSDSLVTDSRQMLYRVVSSQLIIGLHQVGFEARAGARMSSTIGTLELESIRRCPADKGPGVLFRMMPSTRLEISSSRYTASLSCLSSLLQSRTLKQDAIAGLLRDVFRGPNDGGEKRIRDVGDHHPDCVS